MTRKRKRTRTRLWKRALLVGAVLAVLGVPAVYYGGRWALERRFQGWRAGGVAAAATGDHAAAADLLGKYLKRRPDDTEALGVYIKSRELAELPNGQHVAETISALRLLLGKEPDRLEERRHLLELYARFDSRQEALDAAKAVLARAPGDARALEVRTDVLTRQRQDRDALVAAEAWVAAAPLDVKAQVARLSLRSRLGYPRDSVVGEAQKLHDANPNDPRFELLLGYAHSLTENQEDESRKWLKAAASRQALPDDVAVVLAEQLDNAGMSQDALAVLQRLVARGAGADTRHALGRRLWELGKWEQAADALRDVDPSRADTDATLAAMKAMALANAGKAAEAEASRNALAARKQAAARAWTLVLRRGDGTRAGPEGASAGAVDDRQVIAECRSALMLEPQNAHLYYFMGDAYARLGELDLAIQAWQGAAAKNPAWTIPSVRLVEALLQKGQVARATFVASKAARRDREHVASVVTFAKAWAAGIDAGTGGKPEELMELVEQVQKAVPGEETTLLIRVQLLAREGKKQAAAAALRGALARTPAPDERFFLGLASASRKYGLGAEQECFARCEQAHGATPSLAYAWAIDRVLAENAAAGLREFDEVAARAKEKAAADVRWRLARAQYLDLAGAPEARSAWVAVGDASPENLAVQHAAASARAVRGDWDFMQRTVERLRKLTGDESLSWRLAQARLMVESPRTDDDYIKGSVLLNDVLKEHPRSAEAHVLLAEALVRMKRLDGAADHLSAALNADPTNVRVRLRLAGLLQARGDLDRARLELDQAAPLLRSPAERRQAALLLAQQGNRDRAVQLLEEQPGPANGQGRRGADDALDDLVLASLYRRNGQSDKAEAVVRKALEKEPPGLWAIEFAASLYASQGRREDAERALGRLAEIPKLEPGVKELVWGGYFAQLGDLPKAVEQYRAAAKLAPGNAATWRVLAATQVAHGRFDEAAATVEEALRALPGDKGFQTIRENAGLLRESAGDPALRPLVLSVVRAPLASEPARELLRLLAEEGASKDAERVASRLQQLAERFPEFLPARVQLVQRYGSMGRRSDAMEAARHAMKDFPADPAPARLAVQVAAEHPPRWADMQSAAQAWKQRAPEESEQASLAIATAQMGQSQFDAAVAQLEPYAAGATADPQRHANLLAGYCAALANAGKAKAAAELLWPLASKADGAVWRARWVQVAVDLADATEAARWLDRVAEIVPAGALEERVVLAQAYDALADRAGDAALAQKSKACFKQVLDNPRAPVAAVMLAAGQAERTGDAVAAESLYRRAIALDAALFAAHNNLAMLVVTRGGDLAEAKSAAAAAVRLAPRTAAAYDTLAFVQAKAGDYKSAADSMRVAISLEPDNAKWRVRLAQYLLDGGQPSEAARAVAAIDDRRLDVRGLSPSLQEQLGTIRRQIRGSKPT